MNVFMVLEEDCHLSFSHPTLKNLLSHFTHLRFDHGREQTPALRSTRIIRPPARTSGRCERNERLSSAVEGQAFWTSYLFCISRVIKCIIAKFVMEFPIIFDRRRLCQSIRYSRAGWRLGQNRNDKFRDEPQRSADDNTRAWQAGPLRR